MGEAQPPGRIEVSPTAIATIVGRATLQSYGVVGMASRRFRDGVAELLNREHFTRGVDVRVEENAIVVDVYVILEYGTRISEVARNIMQHVKFSVERSMGMPVSHVNVHVQGLRVSQPQ